MHIPDGFISAPTVAVTGVLAAAGVGFALRQVKRELPPRRVPLLGLGAAFLFAAQMINFPVVGGTSGHLVGGLLMAALLGPAAAIVVLTTVLIVQSFLFSDGGVLALGANVLNMAIVGGAGAWVIFYALSRWRPTLQGRVAAVAFAGWCSTVLAAMSCAGQLAVSGTASWGAAFSAMTGIHMIIGIGEGLISALVYLGIERTRPELVAGHSQGGAPGRNWILYGLLASLVLAAFVAPFASPWPDGLEKVAERLGFEHAATTVLPAPAADYQAPYIDWPAGATAVAGVVGALVVFVLALLLARFLTRKERSEVPTA